MKLLNTKSRKVESFEANIPSYVILSHTWEEEEVLFQDLVGAKDVSHLKGYRKITQCCEQAVSDGYDYVWVDTCCIDKTSSAELSEAINSMFQWYQDAHICYAYLCDIDISRAKVNSSQLATCRWFTRGWTLQELIAPIQLVFYNKDWVEIGTKGSLRMILSDVTGIDVQIFVNAACNDYSIAQRMSWASRRSTTRTEDQAYCLMGIFGVNMPLLYGEGKKSFVRLQEEIMKRSDDHSLFAWKRLFTSNRHTGLLATSPEEFLTSGNIIQITDELPSSPYSITNKGVQMTLPFLQDPQGNFQRTVVSETMRGSVCNFTRETLELRPASRVAVLNCTASNMQDCRLMIVLEKVGNETYLKRSSNVLLLSPSVEHMSEPKTLYIRNPDVASSPRPGPIAWRCIVECLPLLKLGFSMIKCYPNQGWRGSKSTWFLRAPDYMKGSKEGAALLFTNSIGCRFALVMQRRNLRKVYAHVTQFQANENAEAIVQRCKTDLKPLDRIMYELDEEKVLTIAIRQRPQAHYVNMDIQLLPMDATPL